jgi:uncharacterized protein YcbX
MRIERITRYPVKGLSPEEMEEVDLAPGQGVPHDRRYAFAQGDSGFDPANPVWMKKRNFACLAANPRVARLRTAYDPVTNTLLLKDGEVAMAADLATAEGRQAAGTWITTFMGEEARGALTLAEAPGHAFTDIPDKAVSLIGLASIAALSEQMGAALDPIRFRANILFSGALPWAEFDWLGREVLLGGARLRVFKRIQRCAATEVNPETAQRDAQVPLALRKAYGHADMGVYAEVLEGGRVAVGDTIVPV